MSKIICEICGTAYAETSTQCPICGYVRSAEAAVVTPEADEGNASQYTYVKGGRFSKSNVKKRNRANQKPESAQRAGTAAGRQRAEQPKKKKNVGFITVAIILLLLLLAFVLFLVVKFFWPALPDVTPVPDNNQEQQEQESEDDSIACTGVELDVTELMLAQLGEARMIYATVSPEDTTDTVTYSSSDESVVTVSDSGKVVAVGNGEATITVTCGTFKAECKVICSDSSVQDPTEDTTEATEETTEATEPTEATTQEPTIVLEQGMFNRKDFTLSRKGEKWTLYTGDIDVSLITWTTDNPNVATIENGVVKAVGKGTTKVYAEYNGVKISCIVRCNF